MGQDQAHGNDAAASGTINNSSDSTTNNNDNEGGWTTVTKTDKKRVMRKRRGGCRNTTNNIVAHATASGNAALESPQDLTKIVCQCQETIARTDFYRQVRFVENF